MDQHTKDFYRQSHQAWTQRWIDRQHKHEGNGAIMTSKLDTLKQAQAHVREALKLIHSIQEDTFICEQVTEKLQELVTGPGWTMGDWAWSLNYQLQHGIEPSDVDAAFEGTEEEF